MELKMEETNIDGYVRLVRAVLIGATKDMVKYTRILKENPAMITAELRINYEAAKEWIESHEPDKYPLPFEFVCEVLGYDPEHARIKLFRHLDDIIAE